MLGWHQHKVTSGDVLMVNHDVGAKTGQRITLDKVS
jgi:ribosomal protein L21